MAKKKSQALVPVETIQLSILEIRGQKVILDTDLAELYGVATKRLNEQVKRNLDRFPEDFMFQLTKEETESLKSQIATSKPGRGGRRTRPYAFTEHGVIMAANVLNSPIATQVSVQVVRAFVQLRQMIATHRDILRKVDALEKKYDAQFRFVFDALRKLMAPQEKKRRRVGFRRDADE